MAAMTFDGQSFMLDGRRVWLVSGSLNYTRVPRAYWADRVAAAKNAGLNCIETSVIWARHEPRHGHFDFTGENDLRHFVQLVGQAGMYVILRPGPFVDAGWDMGGLPPWLLTSETIKLRTANQAFLEACSRYITAVAEQLRDLQVNSPAPRGSAAASAAAAGLGGVAGVGVGGPIILLQNESGWTCGDDTLASAYLGELHRYFREAGFTVPIINANDLWQSVEGEIDGWTGFGGLLAHLRQLGTVRPAQPRVVIDFEVGYRRAWNRPALPPRPANVVLRCIAEVLAAGGQINLSPFHGGTNSGFSAGRDPSFGHDGFLCTSNDAGAPLNEAGLPGESYGAVRRICTFASRFSRVLSHLDPARQPVALLPEAHALGAGGTPQKGSPAARVSVVHAVGSQGGVAFVFGDDAGENSREPMSLVLPDGSTLPVDLGERSVVWCLLDARLTGRANLDYCNLCALALVGTVLVLFGPAGSRALLSINGAPLEALVPEDGSDAPFVQEHEGITVVIASDAQVDRIAIDDTGVYLGATGHDRRGRPIVPEGAKSYHKIDADGKRGDVKITPQTPVVIAPASPSGGRGKRPSLGEWAACRASEYLDGTSPRYANINKPADLVTLGAPYGYGWYRVNFASGGARKTTLMFPQSGHRLHVALDGEPVGVVGVGPGASRSLNVSLRKGTGTMVVLAENAGRVCSGADLGEHTGLYGHPWEVTEIKAQKPKLVAGEPVDLLAFRAPLWRLHRDDTTDSQLLTWRIDHRSKASLIIEIGAPSASERGAGPQADLGEREDGIVLLNGKPVHYFSQPGGRPVLIDASLLVKGNNTVQIAMVGSTGAAAAMLSKAVRFFAATESFTTKGEWAFAKWEPPAAEAFTRPKGGTPGMPTWWRCPFNAGDADPTHPLLLEIPGGASGLTKGQIYVNGRHVGRYFVGTADGKKVPPQSRYLIPRALLAADGADELVIFDEHGHNPGKCRLISDVTAKGGAFDA